MSKKLFFMFYLLLYVSTKKLGKVVEKQSAMSLSVWDREISPSNPSVEISLSYMDTHGGLLYSFTS